MELVVARGARTRATVLWLSVTAVLGALAAYGAPLVRDLLAAPGPTFADALVQGCAAAALVAAAALWLSASDVVWGVLRARTRRRTVGPLRRAILTACGVTVLAATAPGYAAPSGSDVAAGSEVLDGLPLPDRAVATPDRGRHPARTVVVRAGDSLWAIAARQLGPGATRDEVATYWHRLRELNTAAIADPDLIHPGQPLRLPPT